MAEDSSGSRPDRASDRADSVIALYQEILDSWNRRDAEGFAAWFAEHGPTVGFAGSQVDGRTAVAGHLRPNIADRPTPAYVGIVRGVRFLTPEVAILRAVAGLVAPGHSDLDPALDSIQSLIAAKRDGVWRAELFQSTPAAFHGRPELSAALTDELQRALRR